MYKFLFVDDDRSVLKSLERVFIQEGHEIYTAVSGLDALPLLEAADFQVVISDHSMPGMSGVELLTDVMKRWPDTIRIMLTGCADTEGIMDAVSSGVIYKFITKPWNNEDLRLTVNLALEQYKLVQENRKLKEINKKQQIRINNHKGLTADNKMVGNIFVSMNLLTKEELKKALYEKKKDEFLGDTLVRMGITTEGKIVEAFQRHLKIDFIDLKELDIDKDVIEFLPRELCEKNRLIPVSLENNKLTLAMADPSDFTKYNDIEFMTGLKILPLAAKSSEIMMQLKKVYDEKDDTVSLADLPDETYETITSDAEAQNEIDIVIEEDAELNLKELISFSKIPPIIRIVNAIIYEAIRLKASDIHIEPKSKFTVVRYRIDGMLHSKMHIPSNLHAPVISRIKILGKMDISERRAPQDGRISVKSGARNIDLRLSSMPTINGEKVVMRILDKSASIRSLIEFGIFEDDLKKISGLTKKPQGIIISTGPTGSGKTTMLYSMLNEMLQNTKNFETIEDPVEYFLEEANQVYVKEKVGLSFASVLRATLRQDPDVILVGEMRDFETSDIAFKAALTGHMVLSSLHTNSSVASITRLIDLGIKPYLIASALEGIIAQRLVRKNCPYCSTIQETDTDLLELLKVPRNLVGDKVRKGKGCGKCNKTGYLGRLGIFEIFIMNDDFRHLINSNYKEAELQTMARASGMKTLIEYGLQKVREGDTTIDELIRVIGPQTVHECKCVSCNRMINAKFLFCPFCGSFKKNICKTCRQPVDESWLSCPYCGGKI